MSPSGVLCLYWIVVDTVKLATLIRVDVLERPLLCCFCYGWFVYFVFCLICLLTACSFICTRGLWSWLVYIICRNFYLKISPNSNFHTKIIIFPFMKCCRPESASIRYLVVKFLVPRFQCNQRLRINVWFVPQLPVSTFAR